MEQGDVCFVAAGDGVGVVESSSPSLKSSPLRPLLARVPLPPWLLAYRLSTQPRAP